MREIITQLAVGFIVWSLAVELTGWAIQRYLGENWWRSMLGEHRSLEADCQTVPVSTSD